ncbi:MAG: hypothetical protein ACRDH5_04285 [bacterium]
MASWVGPRRAPLTEPPVLYVYTLEEALGYLYGGARPWDDESTPPELAERQRRDFETVLDLLTRSLFLGDNEEVAPGVRRGELLRVAERVARRMGAYRPGVRAGSRRKRR